MCDHRPIPILKPEDVEIPVGEPRVVISFREWAKKHGIPTPYVNFANPPPSPAKVAIALKLSESSDVIKRRLRELRRAKR